MDTKIIAVIPARLASQRFPRKVLHPFFGLPMLEHVRRRALLCEGFADVVLATCDEEVRERMEAFGAKVVMTHDGHKNGTDRAAEVASQIDGTHFVVLQGDEPLMVPEEVNSALKRIQERPEVAAWNGTAPLTLEEDLDNRAVVKCTVSAQGRLMLCSRRAPCYSSFQQQVAFTRKVLGFIAFRKEVLLRISDTPQTPFEQAESIEQMRMIESGIDVYSVPFHSTLPSVNLPSEVKPVEIWLENDPVQKKIHQLVQEMPPR